tara:strand:- start:968 stop:1657 length:690 start_codon:yes stop_codon:yes gene_type:complete
MDTDLVFVDGIVTKSSSDSLIQWSKFIFIFQLAFFLYRVFYLNVPHHWMSNTFMFVLCGIYIPICGYEGAKKLKHTLLKTFSTVQCLFSCMAIFSIITYASNVKLLEDACEQCMGEFRSSDECELEYSDELNITLGVEDCKKIPSITQISVYSFFMACIAFSGCWTALLASRVITEKHVEAVLVEHVPDIEHDVVQVVQIVREERPLSAGPRESIVEDEEVDQKEYPVY